MNSCPSPEILSQLLDGTLLDEQTASIRGHLAGCSACQAALDQLSEKTALRQWAAAGRCLHLKPADEPDLAPLLEKLAATPPAAPYLSGETADYGLVDGSLSFLASPQQEGDLGQLGPYRVLAELGRGGMGIVLLAYDPELQRTVALKVLPPDCADDKARARFVREARAAAGIAHDNVVPVYAVATPPDESPYLVMQYVDGLTLRERIKAEGRLDPREAARVCAQAAEGLAAAHRAGLVHRDIKPANIILDRAQGRAKIMDFGLARATSLPAGITQAGTILGTPEYMSPEQVQQPDRVDARTDLYGLGVTLYEALTGEVPFRGVAHMVLQQIVNDDPRPPRRLNDKVPRDLETICLKCLHKEPAKRYADAAALADDLKRFLAGKPIQARPVGRSERLWRWCRRNPLAASLVAALFLVLTAGLAGVTSQWLRAEAKAKQLEISLYYNHIALADREVADHNLGRAEELLDECPAHLRGWEWHHLKRRLQVPPISLPIGRRLSGGKGFDLAFSPDGRFLAVPSGDKHVTVWDASTGQKVLTLRGHQDRVLRLAFSPDGHFLLSGGDDKSLRLWDAETGKEVRRFEGHEGPVHGVAFSPDGRRLASASYDQTVKVWDATTGALLFTFPASFTRNVLVTLAFSADGRLLAAPGVDHTVTVWDVTTGRNVAILRGHTDQVFSMAFTPDGRRLVTAGWEGSVKVWDLTSSARAVLVPQFSVDDLSHAAWSVALSADGQRLALAGSAVDETVRVYDVRSGKNAFTLRGHSARVVSVAFSPDGRRLASGSLDKTVKLWDMETGQEVLTLRGHTNLVGHVVFDPSGQRLASASDDGTVRVWDATPLEEDSRIRTLRGHTGIVYGVAFSPDGKLLASASSDQAVRIWEVTTGREVLLLRGHNGPVYSVAFSPDGKLLASASEDKTLKLWDARTGAAVFTFDKFRGGVRCVTFSPHGRRLATTDATDNVQVWDAGTGQELLPLRGHKAYVKFVAFSHDGKLLATGSVDGTVRLWDASTGKEAGEPYRYSTRVMSMALSPDSRLLASGDADQTVTVRETATRNELFSLAGHTNYVIAMAFNCDGRRLASASWQEVIVWDTSTGRKIKTLSGLTGTIRGVAFSPDGRRLAACGGYKTKGEIKIWDHTLWDKQADP